MRQAIAKSQSKLDPTVSHRQHPRVQATMREVFRLKKHFLNTLRLIREKSDLLKGKPFQKSRKLHTLSAIKGPDGVVCEDMATGAKHVHNFYGNKWQKDADIRNECLHDICALAPTLSVATTVYELFLCKCPNINKCDSSGICVHVLWLWWNSKRHLATNLYNKLMSKPESFHVFNINACAFGKDGRTSEFSRTRIISPLPVIIRPLDFAIAHELNRHLDSVTTQPPTSFVEGAKKGRQPMDAVWPAKMLIQASLDDFSRGALAVADIKQYFDNIDVVLICSWLFADKFDHSIIAAIVCVHSFIPMVCAVGSSSFNLSFRCLGIWQGSRRCNFAHSYH